MADFLKRFPCADSESIILWHLWQAQTKFCSIPSPPFDLDKIVCANSICHEDWQKIHLLESLSCTLCRTSFVISVACALLDLYKAKLFFLCYFCIYNWWCFKLRWFCLCFRFFYCFHILFNNLFRNLVFLWFFNTHFISNV